MRGILLAVAITASSAAISAERSPMEWGASRAWVSCAMREASIAPLPENDGQKVYAASQTVMGKCQAKEIAFKTASGSVNVEADAIVMRLYITNAVIDALFKRLDMPKIDM